ncbi:efflux RND transporter periplasmic adaptor subunit [bacterium]|nr:efflux RND transporter periplasmic adaptor subunit [bacterium]
MRKIIIILALIILLTACEQKNETSNAYGNFQCVEVTISSETMGIITDFDSVEGDYIERNQIIAIADTTDKQLLRDEIMIQIELLNTKYEKAEAEQGILAIELSKAKRDVGRHEILFNQNAIAREVLENYQHKEAILEKQYSASGLNLSLIKTELKQLAVKLEQIKRELSKSYITSPFSGTLLVKYVEAGELVTIGKPLFKLANLEETYLKAYVSETQLSQIALNDQVTILYDSVSGLQEIKGIISFISDKAEFTPKTIQTRDERANLVYAIKIRVEYEEAIKIGMPAEVLFQGK